MTKLPLTRPIYMAELGRRMGMPAREARRALRRVEHSKKARILFKTRRTQRGRLWTTEAILRRYCPQFIDRPRKTEQETRVFVKSLTQKVDDLEDRYIRLKDWVDHELSELRAAVGEHVRRGHG
jgi:hypothetical protein